EKPLFKRPLSRLHSPCLADYWERRSAQYWPRASRRRSFWGLGRSVLGGHIPLWRPSGQKGDRERKFGHRVSRWPLLSSSAACSRMHEPLLSRELAGRASSRHQGARWYPRKKGGADEDSSSDAILGTYLLVRSR